MRGDCKYGAARGAIGEIPRGILGARDWGFLFSSSGWGDGRAMSWRCFACFSPTSLSSVREEEKGEREREHGGFCLVLMFFSLILFFYVNLQ